MKRTFTATYSSTKSTEESLNKLARELDMSASAVVRKAIQLLESELNKRGSHGKAVLSLRKSVGEKAGRKAESF